MQPSRRPLSPLDEQCLLALVARLTGRPCGGERRLNTASVAYLISPAEAVAERVNLSDKVAVVVQTLEPATVLALLFPDKSHGASNSKAPHGIRFASDTLGDSAMSLVLPLPSLGVSSLDLGRSLGRPFFA